MIIRDTNEITVRVENGLVKRGIAVRDSSKAVQEQTTKWSIYVFGQNGPTLFEHFLLHRCIKIQLKRGLYLIDSLSCTYKSSVKRINKEKSFALELFQRTSDGQSHSYLLTTTSRNILLLGLSFQT